MIPLIQHRIWIGPPLPELYAGWLETWQNLHLTWKHRLWDESNLAPLHNQDLYDRAEEITTHSPWQYRSDVIRYELLYEHGGVYLDMDFEPVKAIDPLMGEPWVVTHARRFVGNAAMAFPPQHPAMAEAIDLLADTASRLPPGAPNTLRSGPQFWTPIARRHKVKAWPEPYFFPYDSTQLGRAGKVHGTYATHHFNNRRTVRNRPL